MIHFDEDMIETWAQACRSRHPGVRLENWRIYVRTVIAAINGGEARNEPLRAAFNDGPAAAIVNDALVSLKDTHNE